MNTAQQVNDAIWNAFGASQFADVRQLSTPDCEVYLPGAGALGIDGALEAAKGWKTGLSDFGYQDRTESDRIDGDNNSFSVTYDETFTHDGDLVTPFGVFPATGRKIHIRSRHTFVVKDGLMHRWFITFNWDEVLPQLR